MGDQDKPSSLPIPGLQDLLDQHDVEVARQKSVDSQSRARRDDTELSNLGAGADPDYVRSEEHFEGMTLEAMYAAVHGGSGGTGGLDAAGLQAMRKTWFECFSEVANLSTFNLMGLNRIFGNGKQWEGASASAAQTASQQYSGVANQISRVFETMSQRLDSLAWAAEAVKMAVPEPPASVTVVPNPDNPVESILPGLINPGYADQADNAKEQARQAAIRALNSVYKETFPPAGSGVPTYATVPQIGTNGDPGAVNGANPPGINTGAGAAPGESGNPSNPDATTEPPQGTVPAPSASPATQPAGAAPTDTTPAGARPLESALSGPGTTTAPASVTTSPGSPSTPATPGTPGLTGPGRGPTGLDVPGPGTNPRPGGPGSSVPGAPGGATPGAVSPAARAASAARSGVGQGGSMAPGAGGKGRKNGEGDGEHRAPDYLRGVAPDWTEGLDSPVEVIGDNGLPDTDHYVSFELPPVDTVRPPTSSFVEPAHSEPQHQTGADVAPTVSTPQPLTTTHPDPKDVDPGPKPAESAGFSGAGPSLDDLFAEYGWSGGDSPAAPPSEAPDQPLSGPEGTTAPAKPGHE